MLYKACKFWYGYGFAGSTSQSRCIHTNTPKTRSADKFTQVCKHCHHVELDSGAMSGPPGISPFPHKRQIPILLSNVQRKVQI